MQGLLFIIYSKLWSAVGKQLPITCFRLPSGGDFGAVNCQYSMNLNRSTKPDLTTLPPLAANECYRFGLHCQTNKNK